MALIFPQLPGLAFPVDCDFGLFDTTVETSVNGKEARYINRTQARVRRSLSIEGLDSSGQFASLVAQSLQTLQGFHAQCYGAGLVFYYWDPADNAAASQQFGVGDGTTTTFQLARSRGGWIDFVFAPFVAAAPALIPSASAPNTAAANVYAPTNVYENSSALATSIGLGNLSLTGSQTDPNGGSRAVLLTETAATGAHDAAQASIPIIAGSALTFSAYLKAGSLRYCELILDNGSSNGLGATFDLSAGAVTASGKLGSAAGPVATISAASGGYFRCAVSGVLDTTSSSARASIVSNANATTWTWYPSYAGSLSNTVYAAFPQVELAAAPGAPTSYKPTLATLCYGQPSITVGGTYLDPSAYTIANGAVTFAAAPGAGMALVWSGNFYWPCNFDDDKFSASQIMSGLWESKKLSFTTRIF